MKDIRQTLGVKIESPYWDKAYNLALEEKQVPDWLTVEYIDKLNEEYNLLRSNYETIRSALPCVAENSELCLLAKTLYHIIGEKTKSKQAFTFFELPNAPEGVENTLGYDFVGIFPILAHLEHSWKELEERGVDAEVISDSLVTPDNLVTYSFERLGKYCLGDSEFMCYDVSLYVNYLRIGRLRFEMYPDSQLHVRAFKNDENEICILIDSADIHKSGHLLGAYGCTEKEDSFFADICETADAYEGYATDKKTGLCQSFKTTLSKNEWTPVFSKGDNVMKVHIPYGGKLDKTECESSYTRAREIFQRCYPEISFKNFVVTCWMLSPELRDILKPESNIISFQNKYNIYPVKSTALDALMYVYNFRGNSPDELDFENLPEDNTLRRGVKQKMLEGKFVHEFGGFFPW